MVHIRQGFGGAEGDNALLMAKYIFLRNQLNGLFLSTEFGLWI